MATWQSDDAGFRIDNASGTLTDISQWVNQSELAGNMPFLDDTGLGDDRERTARGLATAVRIPISGRVCSTTEAIFSPLVNGTSITKTFEVKARTGRYYYGECWPENTRITIVRKELQVFSCDLVAEFGMTRTSVAQV